MLFLISDFLSYPYDNFPKVRGYVGFESGGYCSYPAGYDEIISGGVKKDRFKCDLDDSGYYNP